MKRPLIALPVLLAMAPGCTDLGSPAPGGSGGQSGTPAAGGSTGQSSTPAAGGSGGSSSSSSACDPSFLGSEGLTGAELAVEAKYVNQPPLSQVAGGDNLAVTKDSARFLRQADYAFAGELLDAPEGLGAGDGWDKAHAYQVRVDTEYWNLGDAPLPASLTTTVIGWIPPKPGKLYFWATGSYHAPTVLSSYVAAEPRTAWFCPTAGLYRGTITAATEQFTECPGCGDGSDCVTFYSYSGQITETLMGRIATGQPVAFSGRSAPAIVAGQGTFLFQGVAAEGMLSFVDPALPSQRVGSVPSALGCSNP